MEKANVDLFIAMNSANFRPLDLTMIKERLEKLPDDKFYLIQNLKFQKPDTIFLLSILFPIERFLLNDVALGIVKILTCQGCGIWGIIDIFTAKERTYKYNLKLFNDAIAYF